VSEAASVAEPGTPSARSGLKENWRQFALVLINAFVGGMIGIEGTAPIPSAG
jgi:hypothetical protein